MFQVLPLLDSSSSLKRGSAPLWVMLFPKKVSPSCQPIRVPLLLSFFFGNANSLSSSFGVSSSMAPLPLTASSSMIDCSSSNQLKPRRSTLMVVVDGVQLKSGALFAGRVSQSVALATPSLLSQLTTRMQPYPYPCC